MASGAPLIADYRDRVDELLGARDLRSVAFERLCREIDAQLVSGTHIHPTIGVRVKRGREFYFFRALIKDDPMLRRQRARAVRTVENIGMSLKRRRNPPFAVPSILEYGQHGKLFWSLEVLIRGRSLPVSWKRTGQLRRHLEWAPRFTGAIKAIHALNLTAPVQNWSRLRTDMNRLLSWALQCPEFDANVIGRVQEITSEFLQSAPVDKLVPVHPDLHARNVLLADDELVILDWDELHLSVPAETFGRHWILSCSELQWRQRVIDLIGRRSRKFWLGFYAFAWFRGIDQLRYELEIHQGQHFETVKELRQHDVQRALICRNMLRTLGDTGDFIFRGRSPSENGVPR